MSFFLTDPPQWTKDAIQARSDTMSGMTGTHAWNTRQNWVRMTSNVRFKETPRQFQ